MFMELARPESAITLTEPGDSPISSAFFARDSTKSVAWLTLS